MVPGQQRVGRNDESVADPAGDHAGESGDEATVDVGELGTVRGSLQDGDLVKDWGLRLRAAGAAFCE